MQEQIMQAVLSALGTILVALIGVMTTKVVGWLNEKGITEKLQKKQYLVDIAVNAVEQIYQEEDGATKLVKAREQALKLMNDNGLDITEDELSAFVEAAVKAMNDAYNSTKEGLVPDELEGE